MEMLNLLNEIADARLDRMNVFLSPEIHRTCPKCEGTFLVGLRDRLNAPPKVTIQEKMQVVVDIFTSIAEDPLMVSMHEVKILRV